MRNPQLGFAPGPALAATALGLGPVGWVAAGLATAIPFLFMRSPRGEYQKFERELYPTLASLSRATGLETMTGWFNELVGTDIDGNRKVFGSWLGQGPQWGDLAAAKIMELAQDNFLWSFQSGRSDGPWVLIGPHPTLGSVVYDIFASIQSAIDYFERSRARLLEQFEAGNPQPADPIEPTAEPIDPGEISAPPDPAQPIDPPAPPPRYPAPRPGSSIWRTAGGILGGILGGIFGGPGGPGGGAGPRPRPPGGAAGNGWLGAGDDWMLWGAAALLLLAATRKKERRKHAARTA